jgi:hypothetical protein
MESETHNYKMPCEKTLHITKCGKHLSIRIGKSGDCQHVLLEVLGRLISILPKEEAIKALKGDMTKVDGNSQYFEYICERGVAGNKCCISKVIEVLEGK